MRVIVTRQVPEQWIPAKSTDMVTHDCDPSSSCHGILFWPLWAPNTWYTDIHTCKQSTHIHSFRFVLFKVTRFPQPLCQDNVIAAEFIPQIQGVQMGPSSQREEL